MNLRQLLLGLGVSAQLLILGVAFYFLHEINQKRDEGTCENFASLDREMTSEYEANVQVPFHHYVTGSGKVGPSSDYVRINAKLAGVIDDVLVSVGQRVKLSDVLFQMSNGSLQSELKERVKEHETSLAKLDLIEAGPSTYELDVKSKELDKIQIKLNQQQKECSLFETLLTKCAVSRSEKDQQDSLLHMITAEMDKEICEYENLKKGASKEERAISFAIASEKVASIKTIENRLEDCKVRSPIEGKVLSINVNKGEYVHPSGEASIVIGNDDPLHLHVFIDDTLAWRVSPTKELRAMAQVPSNPKIHFILNFVAVKPCLNSNKLELVFAFDKGKAPIYLEQNLDVYIEAAPAADTSFLDYQFNQRKGM